jgi:hypothetical protein
VYSGNVVPKLLELICSLRLAAIESPGFFLIFAVTKPDGVPVFLNRTFYDFKDLPINIEEVLNASSPNLTDEPEYRAAAALPGIGTL